MHKWLVELTDDDRGFIISSETDETLRNSISPTKAPTKGQKKEQRERTQV
jgi:hypothetical protein